MMKICVVSPHPDDETLGAGGYLLRLKDEGNDIYWLNMTSMKIEDGFSSQQVKEKLMQVEEVTKAYDFSERYDMELSATRLDEYEDAVVISKIAQYMDRIQPDMLILPNAGDAHSDHRKAFEWCYTCTKRFRHGYIQKVITMEIPSETEFGNSDNAFWPNMYVDISKYLKKKLDILKIYYNEMGEHPFPRSFKRIEALATLRGGGEPCVEYAEAFRILKEFI